MAYTLTAPAAFAGEGHGAIAERVRGDLQAESLIKRMRATPRQEHKVRDAYRHGSVSFPRHNQNFHDLVRFGAEWTTAEHDGERAWAVFTLCESMLGALDDLVRNSDDGWVEEAGLTESAVGDLQAVIDDWHKRAGRGCPRPDEQAHWRLALAERKVEEARRDLVAARYLSEGQDGVSDDLSNRIRHALTWAEEAHRLTRVAREHMGDVVDAPTSVEDAHTFKQIAEAAAPTVMRAEARAADLAASRATQAGEAAE